MTASAPTPTLDPSPPNPDSRILTYAQALNEALREEMRRDERVFVMGEDVAVWGGGGVFAVTKGLVDEFGPERVRDTPISEAAIAGFAVGAAMAGLRPVAEIMYCDFMTQAMDQIVNQAAKMRYMFGGQATVPLVIRTAEGGGRGNAAQHSQSLEAWFAHVPGLKVCVPSTPYDAKGLLKTAIRDPNPVIFIESKVINFVKGPVPEHEYTVPLGLADVKRPGRDITVVGIHTLLYCALNVANDLAQEGIEVEVIDPRTVSPLDLDTIVESVKKTGHLVVAHEAHQQYGVGAEIAAAVQEAAFDYLDAPVLRVAAKWAPIAYNARLESAVIPREPELKAAIYRSLNRG
jgi:pyruvate/2-oxoglutarate/acetoin dehydrogenase E1 component